MVVNLGKLTVKILKESGAAIAIVVDGESHLPRPCVLSYWYACDLLHDNSLQFNIITDTHGRVVGSDVRRSVMKLYVYYSDWYKYNHARSRYQYTWPQLISDNLCVMPLRKVEVHFQFLGVDDYSKEQLSTSSAHDSKLSTAGLGTEYDLRATSAQNAFDVELLKIEQEEHADTKKELKKSNELLKTAETGVLLAKKAQLEHQTRLTELQTQLQDALAQAKAIANPRNTVQSPLTVPTTRTTSPSINWGSYGRPIIPTTPKVPRANTQPAAALIQAVKGGAVKDAEARAGNAAQTAPTKSNLRQRIASVLTSPFGKKTDDSTASIQDAVNDAVEEADEGAEAGKRKDLKKASTSTAFQQALAKFGGKTPFIRKPNVEPSLGREETEGEEAEEGSQGGRGSGKGGGEGEEQAGSDPSYMIFDQFITFSATDHLPAVNEANNLTTRLDNVNFLPHVEEYLGRQFKKHRNGPIQSCIEKLEDEYGFTNSLLRYLFYYVKRGEGEKDQHMYKKPTPKSESTRMQEWGDKASLKIYLCRKVKWLIACKIMPFDDIKRYLEFMQMTSAEQKRTETFATAKRPEDSFSNGRTKYQELFSFYKSINSLSILRLQGIVLLLLENDDVREIVCGRNMLQTAGASKVIETFETFPTQETLTKTEESTQFMLMLDILLYLNFENSTEEEYTTLRQAIQDQIDT